MDRAQAWCLDIEELYNKAEFHSINTSKSDPADVGIFSDNFQVTVFEIPRISRVSLSGMGKKHSESQPII